MNKPRLMLLVASALLVIAGAGTMILVKQDAAPADAGAAPIAAMPIESPQGDASATVAAASAPGRVDVGAAPEVAAASAATTPMPANLPPMPPSDLPLHAQLDGLVARANAGDGEAACRLVIEGERCDHLLRRRLFVKSVEKGMVRSPGGRAGSDLAIEMAARVAESVAAQGDRCDDLDIVKVPDVDESLANAIGQLTLRQKVVLAMLRVDGSLARVGGDPSRMMMPGNSSSELLTPQFYSDHLIRFLDEGIAAGDVLAIEGKVLLHQPTSLPKDVFGLRLALPDQYRFAMYAEALRQLNGPEALGPTFSPVLDKVLQALVPSRRSQLNSEVDQLVNAVRNAGHEQKPGMTRQSTDAAELCAG